jgi:uncharacterized protein
VLLKLALLLDREEYRARAEAIFEDLSGGMAQIPGAFGRLLSALDFYLGRPYEVAIVGEPNAPDTEALVGAVYSAYLPNKVVAARTENDAGAAQLIPLLAERPMREGRATAYVCEGYACQTPTTDPEELKRQLGIS